LTISQGHTDATNLASHTPTLSARPRHLF